MEVDNYEETWWGGQDQWNDDTQNTEELYYFQSGYGKG